MRSAIACDEVYFAHVTKCHVQESATLTRSLESVDDDDVTTLAEA